ncbi:MAG: hypothetical protein ACI9JT_000535 [Polaribacter sp.]|jgi:hypothetical protein
MIAASKISTSLAISKIGILAYFTSLLIITLSTPSIFILTFLK